MVNPFGEGENRVLRPPPTAMVIFGASGDLTHRKLIPALANLAHDDYLPRKFVVIGASRTKFSDQQFRDELRDAVMKYSRRPLDGDVWEAFSSRIYYQSLDASSESDFRALRERIQLLEDELGERLNLLFYLATSPSFFATVAKNLRVAGFVEPVDSGGRATSIVVEKPFGHDLESALALNGNIRQYFAEEQIYRIDHYLGKETVQNILVFRFANSIFEPLWNSRYISRIEISVCEDIGVGNRGDYFDHHGILRDIVQNHALQMLSLLCIEPPISLSDADSIRNEKVKVLRLVKKLSMHEVPEATVRARYEGGTVRGVEVPGYLQEKGVGAHSSTETFIAWRLFIDNWRWAGVPIFIRAGKRLPKRITEIAVFFKEPPQALFRGRQIEALTPNVLSIQVQPHEGICLSVNSKPPGPRMRVRPVEMDFTYRHSFGVGSPDAYERLLLDAMKGDATLFTRDDEIESAWELLSPILESWSGNSPPPLYSYEAGSWGPEAAEALMATYGARWRRL